MPAKSQSQARAAGMAMAAKEGKMPMSKMQGASKSMMKMPKEELEKFASTPRKGLPTRKK